MRVRWIRSEEALASFDRALALDANLAQGHGGRGCALSQLERHDEAVTSLRRALEIDYDSFERFPHMKQCYQNSLRILARD